MVFVEGKQVIFSETFLARHSDQVIISAPLGEMTLNFRLTFTEPAETGKMSWNVDPSGLVQMSITPAHGLGSFGEEPTRLGQHADGSTLYITYSQQSLGGASMMHIFLLKDPAPSAT